MSSFVIARPFSNFSRACRRFAIAVIGLVILTMISGCGSVRVDTPPKGMSVLQAHRAIRHSLSRLDEVTVSQVRFSRHAMSMKVVTIESKKEYNIMALFSSMTNLTLRSYISGDDPRRMVEANGGFHTGWVLGKPPNHEANFFKDETSAKAFLEALIVLREAEATPDNEETDFATFTQQAEKWLSTSPKPEMSEEARTYQVLAKDAFKKKDLDAALDAYLAALDRHPMWPEGHYNAALLAGEAEEFALAAKHMRRYLALAPGAKDAATAKEKYLLWRHKANEDLATHGAGPK